MAGRQDRVAGEIRKLVAELVLYEMRDPRLENVTVTAAEVSRDWTLAKVYVSRLGEAEALAEAVACLNDAAGYVRRKIAPELRLRHIPELRFIGDDTARKAQRLEDILREDMADGDEPDGW